MRNGTHDPELRNDAHDAAAADTAIADVLDPIAVITGGMHESGLLGLTQNLQCLFFRESPINLASVERVLDVREDETRFNRMGAILSQKVLLDAADTIMYSP